MTPKVLSRDETDALIAQVTLVLGGTAGQMLRAHVAALEADNAALLLFARSADARRHELFDAASTAAVCMEYGRTRDELLDALSKPSGDPLPATPHPGAALLERHEKALVRARNEGLEKAATTTDDESSQWAEAEETDDTGAVRRIRDALRDSSKRIRAMKETE